MPKEARVHCQIPGGRPWEGLPGLQGGTPPGHPLAKIFATRTSSESTFPMPIFALMFDDILVSFLPPQNSKSRSQNEPKWLHKSIPKSSES